MPRLFALDKNFPEPIVSVLSDFQADAQLVPLDRIDARMSTLDDWELLLALHHHSELPRVPWRLLVCVTVLVISYVSVCEAIFSLRRVPLTGLILPAAVRVA